MDITNLPLAHVLSAMHQATCIYIFGCIFGVNLGYILQCNVSRQKSMGVYMAFDNHCQIIIQKFYTNL